MQNKFEVAGRFKIAEQAEAMRNLGTKVLPEAVEYFEELAKRIGAPVALKAAAALRTTCETWGQAAQDIAGNPGDQMSDGVVSMEAGVTMLERVAKATGEE